MEFRCPACDTSYRVPVRINQQVRCARCNHVWRISESDFVFAESEPDQDEAHVPEAFSAAGTHDDYDETGPVEPEQDRLAALLERRENWSRDGDHGHEMSGDGVDMSWSERGQPAGQQDNFAQQIRDEAEPDADASSVAPAEHAIGDSPAGLAGQPPAASPLDNEFPDRWFSETAGDASSPEPQSDAANRDAAFERIMEGIEEIITDGGGLTDDPAHDDAAPHAADTQSAYAGDEQQQSFRAGGNAPDQSSEPDDDDDGAPGPRQGKVVPFTARNADLVSDSSAPPHGRSDGDADDASGAGEPAEPMARFIEKIAEEPANAADDSGQAAQRGVADAPAAHTSGSGRPKGPLREHFDALENGMDDALYREDADADAFQTAEDAQGWHDQDYSGDDDEVHEAAQRESLSFDPQQDTFDQPEDVFDTQPDGFRERHHEFQQGDEFYEAWYDDRGASAETDAQQQDRRPPSITDAAMQAEDEDDEALLGEYDLDEADQEATPSGPVEASRPGFGTLTVAAAWALFVIVFGAAALSALSFRNQIAGVLPASAPVFEAVGFPLDKPALSFEDVQYSWQGSRPDVLVLEGEVANLSGNVVELPRLRIVVRDESGAALLEDQQFLGQAALVPGETMRFSVDVNAPADKLKTVELRF